MSTQDSTNSESQSNDVTINMSASSSANIIEQVSTPNEENSNTTGSQRSLSIFPFRFSRDILINNVRF
jgi:hypothetical protein